MPDNATSFAGSESPPTAARVFISYRTREPDLGLAQQFYASLKAAGHHVFLAGESIRLGDNWSQRVDEALEACDFFLLLLSPQSAVSEMVTEEVRRAKDYLLPSINSPLTLCLDEVDTVFNHPDIASDFFGLLRAWHEAAKNSDLWKKLRLVVVHSTEVYIPMNINQSPFNVGLPIELPEFNAGQVQDLAARHGLR
jgi:hypothetical protein